MQPRARWIAQHSGITFIGLALVLVGGCERQPSPPDSSGTKESAAPATQTPAPKPASTPTDQAVKSDSAASNLPPGHPPVPGQDRPAEGTALPPGPPPIPPSTSPPAPARRPTGQGPTHHRGTISGGVEVAGVQFAVPSDWVAQKPKSKLRQAQFEVPGPAGAAEVGFFWFGRRQGGSVQANVDRWVSLFSDPQGGGKPAPSSVDMIELG